MTSLRCSYENGEKQNMTAPGHHRRTIDDRSIASAKGAAKGVDRVLVGILIVITLTYIYKYI